MSSPDSPPSDLIIATRNQKKGREMQILIAPPWEASPRETEVRIRTLDEFPDLPEVVEDAETFQGNARKKASETARAIGHWVIADDSGLTVDALQGAPGVYSARYAGHHGDDDANTNKLLTELSTVSDANRGAAFVCTLAIADPTGTIRAEAEGKCRGQITRSRRGTGGFGYDPVFLIPEYHQTFGELPSIVKQQLSHRARAFGRIRPAWLQLLLAH